MGCKGNCGRAKDEDDFVSLLREGAYVKFNQYGDIVGVTSISTNDFFEDDEVEFLEDDFFSDDEEDDSLIVDVDYVAEMLQGLEPQELKYISKLCEVLIAEGEL